MSLVRGPFTISWGENTLEDVSEVSFAYDVASNDYQTIDGRTYTVDGAITASVTITLLATDVPSLRAIFPQYYVAQGEKLSTGETVTAEEGAIDIVAASCDTSNTNYNLTITACTGEITRLVNARTSLSTVELTNNSLRTVQVTFRGEPASAQAVLQFYNTGAIEES